MPRMSDDAEGAGSHLGIALRDGRVVSGQDVVHGPGHPADGLKGLEGLGDVIVEPQGVISLMFR